MRREIVDQLSPNELTSVRESLKNLFEALWPPAGVAIAILDRNFPGLDVPKHLREGEHPLVLRYDVAPAIPIPDLELRADGISATLSFDRTPWKTFVPWEAIDEMCSISRTELPIGKPKLSLVP